MPSPALDLAFKFVRDAESSVRGLLAQAAERGDYDSLDQLAGVAKELQKIGLNTNSSKETKEIPIPAEMPPYPHFGRTLEGKLRMVGWSEKKGGEYKHESPRAVLDLVVETLEQNHPGGDPTPMDELLQYIVHPETGREFPEYYTRTCLRWLRKLGLVKKHGHSGYGFAAKVPDDPRPVVEAHWARLPTVD